MPGNRCAIYGCFNSYATIKNRENERKITMHAFPKSKDLESEWLRRCSRTDKINPGTSRICSEHFVETDYERDLQHELLGLPLRNKLKKAAVPTVGILEINPKNSKSLRKQDDNISKSWKKEATADLIAKPTSVENQQEQKLIEDVLMTNLILQESASQTTVENATSIKMEDSNSCMEQLSTPVLKGIDLNSKEKDDMSYLSPSTSNNSYSTRNIQDYEEKYAKLLKEHIQMRRNLRKKIKSLNDQVRYYKAKSFKGPKLNKTQLDAQTVLKKILTENQIALLSNKKKRVNWTNQELSVAFTLRHFSKNCYLFLKNKLNYPLPSLSTFKKMSLKAREF